MIRISIIDLRAKYGARLVVWKYVAVSAYMHRHVCVRGCVLVHAKTRACVRACVESSAPDGRVRSPGDPSIQSLFE